jgi:hypothetical protein
MERTRTLPCAGSLHSPCKRADHLRVRIEYRTTRKRKTSRQLFWDSLPSLMKDTRDRGTRARSTPYPGRGRSITDRGCRDEQHICKGAYTAPGPEERRARSGPDRVCVDAEPDLSVAYFRHKRYRHRR